MRLTHKSSQHRHHVVNKRDLFTNFHHSFDHHHVSDDHHNPSNVFGCAVMKSCGMCALVALAMLTLRSVRCRLRSRGPPGATRLMG
mmetsp:Transcript_13313/g.23421  ORF Transcript_13313/g.23421 Transcript_13313/m.23421 type:complete len:86 (+) Transcript_13313:318-575(+)